MLKLHSLFRNGGLTLRRLAQSCLLFCLITSSLATAQEPQEPPTSGSPKEAFDVYRKAIAKGDWSTAFQCLSDDAKKQAVYDAYILGSSHLGELGKKAAKVQSDYGASSRLVDAEYEKRYLAKRSDKTNDGIGDGGIKVLQAILDELVDDKLGFYVETAKLVADSKSTPTLEPLEQVEVAGSRAKGQAQVTVFVFSSRNGGPMERKERKVLETYYFRKVGQSWFIDLKQK